MKSTTTVYGASNRDPAMFTEDMEPRRLPRSGYAKDVAEVEGYVRGFARRRPDVRVTMLRAANVIGPHVDSPITSYFRLPVVPDRARLRPAAAVPARAGPDRRAPARGRHRRARHLQRRGRRRPRCSARRSGASSGRRSRCPAFAVSGIGSALRSARVADFSPEQLGFLTYGRGVDTTRMRTMLGFEPAYTTAEAFADFGSSHRADRRPLGPGARRPGPRARRRPRPASCGAEHG